ncbi:MAG: Verru_Chthon cassette protein B [Blastochloris sp.]|nr:Verru_Chthon cassette protein B [Blastochloris sp.]
MNNLNSFSRQQRRGFSLIEVTMSLGIISIGMMALVAMLPLGLKAFKSSVDMTLQAQIAQSILNQAQQIKFSNLGDLDGTFYFDAEGALLPNKTGAAFETEVAFPETRTRVPSNNGREELEPLTTISITIKPMTSPERSKTLNLFIADVGL